MNRSSIFLTAAFFVLGCVPNRDTATQAPHTPTIEVTSESPNFRADPLDPHIKRLTSDNPIPFQGRSLKTSFTLANGMSPRGVRLSTFDQEGSLLTQTEIPRSYGALSEFDDGSIVLTEPKAEILQPTSDGKLETKSLINLPALPQSRDGGLFGPLISFLFFDDHVIRRDYDGLLWISANRSLMYQTIDDGRSWLATPLNVFLYDQNATIRPTDTHSSGFKEAFSSRESVDYRELLAKSGLDMSREYQVTFFPMDSGQIVSDKFAIMAVPTDPTVDPHFYLYLFNDYYSQLWPKPLVIDSNIYGSPTPDRILPVANNTLLLWTKKKGVFSSSLLFIDLARSQLQGSVDLAKNLSKTFAYPISNDRILVCGSSTEAGIFSSNGEKLLQLSGLVLHQTVELEDGSLVVFGTTNDLYQTVDTATILTPDLKVSHRLGFPKFSDYMDGLRQQLLFPVQLDSKTVAMGSSDGKQIFFLGKNGLIRTLVLEHAVTGRPTLLANQALLIQTKRDALLLSPGYWKQ